MDIFTFLAIIFSMGCIFTIIPSARKSSKLPPGPYQYPIIGNIFQLGSKPHESFAKLSTKYGPVVSLKLGSITTIVISSPEAAKIVKNDIACSSRTIPIAAKCFKHGEFSVAWRPVDNQWRKLRKIMKEQMFSISRLDASQGLRREKLQKLFDYVTECSETGRAVDIGETAFTTTLNLMSATLFSMEIADFNSKSSQEMKNVVWGVMKIVGTPNMADYFPIFKLFDPQGIVKQTTVYFEKLLEIFAGIIDEKLKAKGGKNDLVDFLIDINQKNEAELSREDINHLLLDLFVAGTETTSSTVEWAMAELLHNPDKMSRLIREIRVIIEEKGGIGIIQESDISRLPYLQAVVKETFRLHPTIPLLAPHKAESDVEVNGYTIPKNAQILFNVWATGRDPSIWSNADSFKPERFMNGDYNGIDFRGSNFELIPFGAGRRICPGLPLAYRMVHLMLAMLVGNFNWKLEDGKKPEELDMDDNFGITLHKDIPLLFVPSKMVNTCFSYDKWWENKVASIDANSLIV